MTVEDVAGAAISPASTSVNTLAAFARALVLPFEHPLRLLATGPISLAMLAVFRTWAVDGRGAFGFPGTTGTGWLVGALSLVMAALWTCLWQRGVASNFADRPMAWLHRSVRSLPGYVLASAIWLLVPGLVSLFLITSTYFMLAGAAVIPARLNGYEVLAIGAGCLALSLPGLWLFARLSLVPAVVAAQGWSGAFGRALELGRGRDIGLTAAFFMIAVLVVVLLVLTSIAKVALISTAFVDLSGLTPDRMLILDLSSLGVDIAALTLLGSWITGVPALIVRFEMPSGLDLATFD